MTFRPTFYLSVVLVGLSVGFPSSALAEKKGQIPAQEIMNLEQSMEDWASDTLRQVLPEEKFSAFVKLEFDQDPEMIRAYLEDLDLLTLPGLPSIDSAAIHPTQNRLFRLISQTKVHLLLDHSIEDRQREIAKQVLINKLELDPNSGDVIKIENVDLGGRTPGAVQNAQSSQTQNSRISDWAKYAALGVVIALVLAILTLPWQMVFLRSWFQSRRDKKSSLEVLAHETPASRQVSPADSGFSIARAKLLIRQKPKVFANSMKQLLQRPAGTKAAAQMMKCFDATEVIDLVELLDDADRVRLAEVMRKSPSGGPSKVASDAFFQLYSLMLGDLIEGDPSSVPHPETGKSLTPPHQRPPQEDEELVLSYLCRENPELFREITKDSQFPG